MAASYSLAGMAQGTGRLSDAVVFDYNDIPKETPVETGATWKGRTAVLKGLAEADRVVVLGGFKLRDGMKVNVTEAHE